MIKTTINQTTNEISGWRNKIIFTLKFKVLCYICALIKNITFMLTKNKRLIAIITIVALLLSVPLIAMQFTSEVKWGPMDFLIMGILLLGTGLGCEFILRKVKKTGYRIAIIATILIVFFLIWAELAVGIFGTPFAGS